MPSDDNGGEVVWARVDQGFYVANRPGTFLGCVDRISAREFEAYDAHAQMIGSVRDLKMAMEAVVSGATEVTPA
jgi:hypothetical protein